ncbi:MAG: hypothetical protein A2X23_01835 [Chloroflexi bacterium GWC2_73_18]|nr:MAG: hypothetical protein A2X23_01835 [Chloroflexi bacterium GWC2_73_18]
MKRLSLVMAAAAMVVIPSIVAATHDSTMVGAWESLDTDGSRQWIWIERPVDGVYPVTFFDAGASVCVRPQLGRGWEPGDPRFGVMFRGVGALQGDSLAWGWPGSFCAGADAWTVEHPGMQLLFPILGPDSASLRYDGTEDQLEGLGFRWSRSDVRDVYKAMKETDAR